ncbi:MAG: peptidase M23 [Bacteroidetes bacterium]|nr:peptidase M23 [Bacteroidota bacterium]
MNKIILSAAFTLSIAIATLNTDAQQNKKAAKARSDVKDAKKDLDEANFDLQKAGIDSTEDNMIFKRDAEKSIEDNKRAIAELKVKKWNATEEEIERYNRKVAMLEKRNDKLQRQIHNMDAANVKNWQSFKREFKHEMNELGKSIKDLGINHAK